MDYICKNCGNVFGDYLTVCPSCGTPAEAAPQESKAFDSEQQAQAEAQQQPYQQQAYQQQPYQQQAYQQQPYQQQPYQQQGYQNAYNYSNPNATYQAGAPGSYPNAVNQPKSKLVAGLLGIFLGGLGVHNFYLGFTGKAVAQLLISLISCGSLAIVSAIWGFIEGVLILVGSINTDASGMLLGE